MVLWQARKVVIGECRVELPFHDLRVGQAEPEADDGSHVPQDRASRLGFQLVKELVRYEKPHAELPDLREHGGERGGYEAVGLVDVQVERPAVPRVRGRAAQCRRLYRRDEEAAQHRGDILAYNPL